MTTDDLLQRLRAAVLAGSARTVLDLTRDLTDAQRREIGPVLRGEYVALTYAPDRITSDPAAGRAYELARLATELQPGDAAWALVSTSPAALPDRLAALAPRSAAWKRRFATSALRRGDGWWVVHAWVGAGVVPPPSSPEWPLGVLRRFPWAELGRTADADPVVATVLTTLLDTPGVGKELGRHARYGSTQEWRPLVEACGGFDPARRDAVLDGCLSALGTAPPSEAAGFVAVLQHASLTDAEVARRQGRYAGLLLAPSTPAWTLAADALDRVLEVGALDAATLLDVTPEVLQHRTKVRVHRHLRLVEKGVERGAVDVTSAAAAVVDALDPARSDVAETLAATSGRWADGLDAGAVAELRATVSAAVPRPWPGLRVALGTLAPRVDAEHASPTASGDRPADVRASEVRPVDLPALGRVHPVADLDELLVLMEEELPVRPTPVAVERALDGMVRLRLDDVPGDTRARAERAWSSWWSSAPGDDVAWVVRAWLAADTPPLRAGRLVQGTALSDADVPPGATPTGSGPGGFGRTWTRVVPAHDPAFLTERRFGLVRLHHLAVAPGPLLALPSREDGTVAVDDLLARLAEREALGLEQELFDGAWALLRLPPAEHAAFLAAAERPPRVVAWSGAVTRRAEWDRTVVRDAFGAQARVWSDPGATAGSSDDPVRAWLAPDPDPDLPGSRYAAWRRSGRGATPTAATWGTTLPSHPDVLVAHVQHAVLQALHDDRADAVDELLRVLGDAREPWRRPSAWAVVTGMSVEHRASRLAASEAVGAGAARGTLPPATLTQALLDVLGPDAGPYGATTVGSTGTAHPKVSRVAEGLADAARLDDRTADVVLRGLLPALPPLMGPPGGHALVAVAAQLAERLGRRCDVPAEVRDLADGRSRSRTATEARRLVAAAGTPH